MHPRRRQSIYVFIVCLTVTGFLVYGCFQQPLPVLIIALAVFSGVTGLTALPAFFVPNRWFRFQEKAGWRWERRYPRTMAFFIVLGVVCAIEEFIRFFIDLFGGK